VGVSKANASKSEHQSSHSPLPSLRLSSSRGSRGTTSVRSLPLRTLARSTQDPLSRGKHHCLHGSYIAIIVIVVQNNHIGRASAAPFGRVLKLRALEPVHGRTRGRRACRLSVAALGRYVEIYSVVTRKQCLTAAQWTLNLYRGVCVCVCGGSCTACVCVCVCVCACVCVHVYVCV
jgi:hypothetical protein